jgi:thioredoxin-like negative regulator of GroEL
MPAASDADIDAALLRAKAENKPLLLYWGAKWCPPCNRLKATLFNRQDFAERSRSFVSVAIDGDDAGAQKLGSRFKVRGYPTLVVLDAQGAELTRLPGEAEADQVMSLMQQGLAGARSVKALLAEARSGGALSANEWRWLAFYSWDTDLDQLTTATERPGLLYELALACPASEPDTAARLLLRALAESDDGKGVVADDALRQRVAGLLADSHTRRALSDILVNGAAEISGALANEPGPTRAAVVAGFEAALAGLRADATLSRADRQSALLASVELARLDQPKSELKPNLQPALLKQVREQVRRNDREISDADERQAVITEAAHLLSRSGLWKESDALLRANLGRSHSPYYLMSSLASNARKLGRNAEALDWYRRAYDRSVGPATRLQWGGSYLSALVDLAPDEAARIEGVARQVVAQAGTQSDAFQERNRRSLEHLVAKLSKWSSTPERALAVGRIKSSIAGLCRALPVSDPQRQGCDDMARI